MKRNEIFNPYIPEPDDHLDPTEQPKEEATVATPELPPYKEEKPVKSLPEQKIKKTEKRTGTKKKLNQEQKKVAEKVKKEPGPPFTEKIKGWLQSQTTRWLLGLFLGFLGLYLGVSFMTYVSSCVYDQSEINNVAIGSAENITNAGGEGGARLSEFLINECFGIGAFVIIFWLLAMSLKQLIGKPRFKTVDFTIKSAVALITVSLIVGLLTIGLDSPVNWGGYHGRFVNEFIIKFVGWSGAAILCLFLICCFVVICMRDLINWVIRVRKKHLEIKRKKAEEEEAERQRKQKLEEMRLKEAADAAKAEEVNNDEPETESEDNSHVSFDSDDSGLYTSLPDFDETDNFLNETSSGNEEPGLLPYKNEETEGTINPETSEMMTRQDSGEALSQDSASSDSASPEVAVDENEQNGSSSETNETESTSETTIAGQNNENPQETEADPVMVVNVNEIAQTEAARNSTIPLLPGFHPYKFPPAEILREGGERINVDATEQMENKERIKKTLKDFGISIVSIEATVGPTVTLYEIVPDRGVKINRIRNLVDDIALSLAATGVRIIAPIPGKGTVGIEVANKDSQTVSMRTVIKSHKYQDSKYKLPVAIGSTISNEVYIADLAKMPHLLVAGATGQGKSVGLNAIIASLLYKKSPDELKFVMIDPKMVEFSLYAKIEAHYLAKIPDSEDPIITDMDKVVATLSSLCVEMDNRYQLLKGNSRNIEEYNEKVKAKKLNPAEGHRFLPYIVVIVDEFSDLIMTAGKEVEIPIARLAQKARAVGMHVIIATQRPSTNVITGIIKANFPARMAFKVSSGVDSKTILDTTGAQQLIGRGDMLIINNAPMVRVQCAFIDTPEVEALCDYIQRQPYGQGAYILPDPVVTGADNSDAEVGSGGVGEKDPLFDEIARLVVTNNTASTSSLQRRYSIGYNRAGKIMDQLEAEGIVGPAHGGKPRSVLVDAITLETILKH